jgi:uncharacterized C2H2 Zn-finger protein
MSSKTKGTQQPWECEHCGKVGKNRANYRRDHGNRCPVYLTKKTKIDRITGVAAGVVAIVILQELSKWVM